MKNHVVIASLLALSGCTATALSPTAADLRLVTEAQKNQGCTRVKLVTVNQRLGPDKPGNAMKKAMNEAASAGANAVYVVSTSMDWAEGASIVAEALHCP
jgi:hypothetical protein